jgi:hypothetical protein
MKSVRLLLGLLFVSLLAACATEQSGWIDAPLKDTSWKLVTIEDNRGSEGRRVVSNTTDIQMNLRANGDVDFTLGCQQGTTRWESSPGDTLDQGAIRFYGMQIAATSCEPDQVVQRFLQDFKVMRSYVLIQNHLYINTMANETTYGWRQINH